MPGFSSSLGTIQSSLLDLNSAKWFCRICVRQIIIAALVFSCVQVGDWTVTLYTSVLFWDGVDLELLPALFLSIFAVAPKLKGRKRSSWRLALSPPSEAPSSLMQLSRSSCSGRKHIRATCTTSFKHTRIHSSIPSSTGHTCICLCTHTHTRQHTIGGGHTSLRRLWSVICKFHLFLTHTKAVVLWDLIKPHKHTERKPKALLFPTDLTLIDDFRKTQRRAPLTKCCEKKAVIFKLSIWGEEKWGGSRGEGGGGGGSDLG